MKEEAVLVSIFYQLQISLKAALLLSYSVMSNSVNSWAVAHQAPLSMGLSRQEYWSGFPFPSPGDLPDPRIKPESLIEQADSLPSEPILNQHLNWMRCAVFRKMDFQLCTLFVWRISLEWKFYYIFLWNVFSVYRSNLSWENKNIKQIHEIPIDYLSLNLFRHSEMKLLVRDKVILKWSF